MFTLFRNRARLITAFVLLFALQSLAQTATKPVASTAPTRRLLMWKATSPTATVYLLGSIHLASKSIYPLPAAVEEAFASSKVLGVEINMKETDPLAMAQRLQPHMIYPQGDQLSKHLSKETSDALDEFCAKYSLPRQALERLRPWAVAMMVSVLPLQKAGADPQHGIDMHFMDAIKPPQRIDAFETVDFQISLFTSLSEQEQVDMLVAALKQSDKMRQLENAFFAADVPAIEKGLNDGLSQRLMKRMIDDRNITMAAKIDEYLKGKEPVFVVVGAAHLIGEKGVVKILQDKNYKVEQITAEW